MNNFRNRTILGIAFVRDLVEQKPITVKKEEIHLYDIHRILFGQAPPLFLLETLIRTLIIFVALLVMIRYLGKRMSGQLSIAEFAVLLTLGAIIAPAMQMPDRGLLAAMLLMFCILIFQRSLNLWGVKNQKVEKAINDSISLIIKEGILQLDVMKRLNISNQQVYAELRSKGIYQLGKVKRMYMEGSGLFSIYQQKDQKPGLPVLPPGDDGILKAQQVSQDAVVCCNCGKVEQQQNHDEVCPNCGSKDWTKAIL